MSRYNGNLGELIVDELGHRAGEVEDFKSDILEDARNRIEEDGILDINGSRDIIWNYTNWPPYIDSGASSMMNIQNKLVEDAMARYFLKAVYNELNEENPSTYRYNKNNNEITYRSQKDKM